MIRKLSINEAKRYGKFDGLHHYIADQDWSKWSENDYRDVMFAIRDADRYQKTVDAGRGTAYTKQRADELWGEVERLIDKANKNADAEIARYKKTANTKDRAKVESSCRKRVSESSKVTIPTDWGKEEKATIKAVMEVVEQLFTSDAWEAMTAEQQKEAAMNFVKEFLKASDKYTGTKTNESFRRSRRFNESAGGEIPYDLVSAFVVLRDYTTTDEMEPCYINEEHKMLCNLVDTLYNLDMLPKDFRVKNREPYMALYDKYGKRYFDRVIRDLEALDSQVDTYNVNDLITDVNDRLRTYGASELPTMN